MDMKFDKAYIIAEIGGNFTDLETAKRLIDDARESGVDAVKLQTYRAETLASKTAMFDMENTGIASQTEYFKKYEIDETLHGEVFRYARGKGLGVFSTPSHMTDVAMLEKFAPDVYKIGADDLTNLPFLREIARLRKPVMLSTGMGTLEEIRAAVNAILGEGNKDVIIMHVVSLYPTAPEHANLKAIHTLQREFPEHAIGYSDHAMDENACIFAAVMGAKVIEKHFTYDKNADGPDHMHSATKAEMKRMVDMVRLYEAMLGSGIKHPVGDEIKNRMNNRKSVVYNADLKRGHKISRDDVGIKRPGKGIAPCNMESCIGRTLARDVEADALAEWGDFE